MRQQSEPRSYDTTSTEKKASYYCLHKAARDASHARWISKNRERWNAYMREYRRKKHGLG